MRNPAIFYQNGFSLLEAAIVILIISFLLGGTLVPLAAQYENTKRRETTKVLGEIKEALYGHAMVNRRLPCPDTDSDGTEDQTGSNCTNEFGELPWSTLGLGQFDGWGQPFVYRVTGDFADTTDGTGCGTATAGVSFELCSTGDIRIDDQSSAGTIVASLLPAIVVSRGKNWVNSGSVDERENTDSDRLFVLRNYSKVAGSEFDDLVAWITPSVLQSRMVSAGRLP